jgi:hypothetical protein
MQKKTCLKCGKEKKLKKYKSSNVWRCTKECRTKEHNEWVKNNKDHLKDYRKKRYNGIDETTKEKYKETARSWRKNNLDKKKKSDAVYREKNREKLRESARKHYNENRESILERAKKNNYYNSSRNKENSKIWYLKNKERILEKGKIWREKNRKYTNKVSLEWRKNNPEKCRAYDKVHYAIKTGKLIRPDFCSSCGSECKPQGHHEDHSKPLIVVWLCVTCHRNEHKKLKELETKTGET